MSNFDALIAKLREIFQIDRPELDFGVYRVLNARAGEIDAYLSTRLKEQVAEAFLSGAAANTDALAKELTDKIAQYEADGVNPDTVPAVQKLREAIAAATTGASEHESQVFSHLLTFFSRYYDKGDFISQRRYKGDTYAIPYSGEEVVLHWANKDQYYTKSGEAFSNYGFKLEDGRSVQFRLVAADTAKDNRKDNDKERRFVLAEERTITRIDEDGEGYDETIVPISEEDGTLVIRFDYKAMPKGTKQDTLVSQAVAAVLADETVKARWLGLTERAPTESNPQRTILEKCLTNYTQKNTADYFIHKDLGGFLRRELDFYIKNEVMNLDDVQNAAAFGAIEKHLRMIQCLRTIALHLIAFLAQIEDFQKKLWLKKKFVVSAHYCVTLDRLPEDLYPAIAANAAQWAQWYDMGMREKATPGSLDDLQSSPHLMVDTALFDQAFRANLLKAIPNLDASLDGLLVHGDNFQALRLLQERYQDAVDTVYIDPPYNSAASEITYKNNYKHSSWLCLMQSRIESCIPMMKDGAPLFIAIDDIEKTRLDLLMESIFGRENNLSTIAIMHNKKGRDQSYFSISHEYTLAWTNNEQNTVLNRLRMNGEDINQKYPDNVNGIRGRFLPLRRSGSGASRNDRPFMYFPLLVDNTGSVFSISKADYQNIYRNSKFDDVFVENLRQKYEGQGFRFILPIRSDGSHGRWRWGYDTCAKGCENGRLFFAQSSGSIMSFDEVDETVLPKSLWFDSRHDATSKGTNILKNIIPNNDFDYPKSLQTVGDFIEIGSRNGSIILDFFGGSGTTAHAIIDLERQTNIRRKYIVVDVGGHFNTVLKPRVQKAVFSAEWRNGKPISA